MLNPHLSQTDIFPGFIPLIRRYLDSVEIDVQARCSIIEYLHLIGKRASGLSSIEWNIWAVQILLVNPQQIVVIKR